MNKKETSNSYSHILKYTSIFGGVQGLVILIGMVRNKLIALLLGPQGMGLMALFNSTVRLISDTTGLGLGMSAVRELSRLYDEEHHEELKSRIELIRSWSLITACLGFVLCVVLSPLINHYTFSWGNHTLHFMLLAPIIALTALSAGRIINIKSHPKAPSFGRDFYLWSALCACNISAIVLHLWRVCHRTLVDYHCIVAVYHYHHLFISLLSLPSSFRFRYLFRSQTNASFGYILSWCGYNGQWKRLYCALFLEL